MSTQTTGHKSESVYWHFYAPSAGLFRLAAREHAKRLARKKKAKGKKAH